MFCKFYRQFYLLCPRIKWKIGDNMLFYYFNCFEWIQGKNDFQTSHNRSILSPYHRHLLSLSNESMTSLTCTKSLAYPKSYEFKIILYTTRLINGEKDGYHLIFHFLNASFCSTHCVFNSYIFVTRGNDYQQKASYGVNNFTVHYPHVSQQKSENPSYFSLSISIAILFALK